MENFGRIIAEHPFCKGLQSDYIDLLIGCASNVRFDADQHLFREGGEANQFYLIREGKVALEVFAPQRPCLTMETVAEGEVLGWSWLVPPYRWHFDARAVGPVVPSLWMANAYARNAKRTTTWATNCSSGQLTLWVNGWKQRDFECLTSMRRMCRNQGACSADEAISQARRTAC